MALRFNADEIFKIGVQIEKNGHAFYLTASEKTEDSDLKNLFLRLAEWELKHVTLFEDLRLQLPQNSRDEDSFDQDNLVHLYLKAVSDDHVFVKGLTLDPEHLIWTSPGIILKTALDFEKDSVVLFSSMKEITTTETEASQVEKLIAEELKHIGFITTQIQKCGD